MSDHDIKWSVGQDLRFAVITRIGVDEMLAMSTGIYKVFVWVTDKHGVEYVWKSYPYESTLDEYVVGGATELDTSGPI
jgi:hypothetical protein